MRPFLERLADPRPMIYDGGFGSCLVDRGLEVTNTALANELYPDAVVDIHLEFINAGAEVIGTNTFVASPLHLEMAGKTGAEVEGIVRRAVEHARTAVEKSGREVYIAGSVGPSPGPIELDNPDPESSIPNAVAREAYERLTAALAEAGVDFFCLETMFSAKEVALAVDVMRKTGLPIAVNMTYKFTRERRTDRVVYKTDWGYSAADLLDILAGGEFSEGDNLLDSVQVLGTNCGAEPKRSEHTGMPYAITGIRQLREAMVEKGIGPRRMMAYPNAGIPLLDKNRQTYYSQTPEEMVTYLPELLGEGAYLVGGCCGTRPAHIRAFRQAVDAGLETRSSDSA